MATLDAYLVPDVPDIGLDGANSGRFVVFEAVVYITGPEESGATTYFMMQASCSTSPSGFITWVNTTGDDVGKPACAGTLGPTFEVTRWTV